MAKNSKEAQARADAKRAGMRSRGWACIVYPESVPDNWIDLLNEAHIQTLISPIHDMDKSANGEPKKPHYHVLAMFDNPVGEASPKSYFGRIGITAPPEKVDTIKGYARYLIHLDDHDKARYDEHEVTALAGASWGSVALDEAEEVNALLDEIEEFIADNGCISYFALCRYARTERPEWTRIIRKNTIHLTALLKSLQWEFER
uniref:Plasmid replication protein n=1 Tax=uncultured prokaryote TaxID=198431 RepID=A0A0H5Q3R1_9ZZZZ|nr:hypothetical protein [uncultured prokaryote]